MLSGGPSSFVTKTLIARDLVVAHQRPPAILAQNLQNLSGPDAPLQQPKSGTVLSMSTGKGKGKARAFDPEDQAMQTGTSHAPPSASSSKNTLSSPDTQASASASAASSSPDVPGSTTSPSPQQELLLSARQLFNNATQYLHDDNFEQLYSCLFAANDTEVCPLSPFLCVYIFRSSKRFVACSRACSLVGCSSVPMPRSMPSRSGTSSDPTSCLPTRPRCLMPGQHEISLLCCVLRLNCNTLYHSFISCSPILNTSRACSVVIAWYVDRSIRLFAITRAYA